MKKFLFIAIVCAAVSGLAPANDEDCTPIVSEPLSVAAPGGFCPPPPPVCKPEPVCAPTPPACPTVAAVPAQPEPEVYVEVPVRKKMWVDEVYEAQETRTRTVQEVRTKVIKPNSPRLTRVATTNGALVAFHKDAPRKKTYLKPVKETYTVPVTRTRKVAVEVEEIKLVPEKQARRR